MKTNLQEFLIATFLKNVDGVQKISLLAILSILICSIQLVYRPDRINRFPEDSSVFVTMQSNTFKASLVVGMSISMPVLVDFILNVVYSSNNLGFTRGSISRGVLLFTNLMTNVVMLFVAIPRNDAVLFLCMFHMRGLMLTYAITAHLWEFGAPVFRCNLQIFTAGIFFMGYGVPILTNYPWFTMTTMVIAYCMISFVGMISFTILVTRWIRHLKRKSFKDLTSEEYSCIIHLIAAALIMPCVLTFIIVYREILCYKSDGIYFIGLTYSSSAFTVIVTVLESRIMNREMYIQQEILGKKRMFVRYVSHEMRTPLNTVIMGLDVLRKELLAANVDPDTLECVEELQKSCDIAVDILNDLLNYEKLDAGLMKLEETLVEAGPFFHTAVSSFQIQARQAGINLLFAEMSEDVSRTLMKVDVSKLSQVVRNFTSNALKFSPHDGTGVVTVTLAVVDKSNRVTQSSLLTKEGDTGIVTSHDEVVDSFVQFRVQDNGAGISLENQKRLFKEIVQFNPGKLQGGGGSGLGLWISRAIVDLHGGGVSVYSQGEGQGSTFTMEIPARHLGADAQLQHNIGSRASEKPTTPMVSTRLGRTIGHPQLSKRGTTIVPVEEQTAPGSVVTNQAEDQSSRKGGFPECKISESPMVSCAITGRVDDISLPLQLNLHLDTDVDETITGKDQDGQRTVQGKRVLVVDDSVANRKMICRALKSRGFRNLVQAGDGEEAVQKVRESLDAGFGDTIDMVLMDYQMPRMDGPTAASAMRGLGFQGMIAGITGNALPADIEYYQLHGANAVFTKPISIDKVIKWIERLDV